MRACATAGQGRPPTKDLQVSPSISSISDFSLDLTRKNYELPYLNNHQRQISFKMAKSSRSSSKKHNNQRLKSNVFGPAESARAERLSQRLLEIAKAPKPESSDVNMDAEGESSRHSFLSFIDDDYRAR